MKKEISVKDFAQELMERIDSNKDIQCCREEIRNLATMASQEMGDKMIEVEWKD